MAERRRNLWILLTVAVVVGIVGAIGVVQRKTSGPVVGQRMQTTVDPSDDCGRFDVEMNGWTLTNLAPLPTNAPATGVVTITNRRDGLVNGTFQDAAGSEVPLGGGAPGKVFDSLVCFIGLAAPHGSKLPSDPDAPLN